MELTRSWSDWVAGKPEEKVAATVADLRHGLAPYAGPDGVVMEGAAWLLTARR